MPLLPGDTPPPDGDGLPLGRPIRLRGPDGPWPGLLTRLCTHGSAVAYGMLPDWTPADPLAPELRRMLGRDWDRYRGLRHRRVRERFCASRLLLKHVAARAVGALPHSVELAYEPGGRPFLRGCDQIDISLSHTELMLLVGITRKGRIGVDAELTDRPVLAADIEQRMCTPPERIALAELPQERRNAAMVRLWTLKEAYSKAIGQGLRLRFSEFGFALSGRPAGAMTPEGAPGTGREWSFGTCRTENRYTTSWALYDAGFGDPRDIADRATGAHLGGDGRDAGDGGRPGYSTAPGRGCRLGTPGDPDRSSSRH